MPVYKDERRGTYYYSFSRSGQRVRSKDYTNRKDCEKDMAKALLTFKASSGQYTISQLADEFLAEKRSRMKETSWSKLKMMLGHFTCTIGSVRLDKLTLAKYADALAYLDTLTKHNRPVTNRYKNKCVWCFKRLCKWADDRYDVHTSVPYKIEPYRNEEKKEMQILTLDQFHDLLAVVDDEVYYALFVVLFHCGLRIGEANALTWQDINFDKGTLTVNKTVDTKAKVGDLHYRITPPKTAKSNRTLQMPQIVSNALSALYDKQYNPTSKSCTAFVFGGHAPIPDSTITKKKNEYLALAGLPRVRLHDFRHSCASLLINSGATPLHVSRWLGHANVTMTLNTYSHLWDGELQNIAKLIDDITGQEKPKTVRKNVRKNLVA